MKTKEFHKRLDDAKANPAIIANAWILAHETGREFDDMLNVLASMYVNARYCDELVKVKT